MNEIENIKAGLTYLLDINDLKNNVTVTEDGKSHSMNVKDLKEASEVAKVLHGVVREVVGG